MITEMSHIVYEPIYLQASLTTPYQVRHHAEMIKVMFYQRLFSHSLVEACFH